MNELIQAKIFKSGKRRFECQIQNTHQMVEAITLREIYKEYHPVVGDNVLLQPATNSDNYEIVEVLERENEIYRRIVRENKKKVIAANVDVIFIVTSISKPAYKPNLIDRYLLRAMQWDIPAVIIFNKMDEFEDQFDKELEKMKFEKLGAQCFFLSSTDPESYEDFFRLKLALKNKTAICLGQSGVGKSKLISALSEGKADLLSGKLAKKVDKGAHTTTWAEIIDCGDFLMVDSPGVRSQSIQDIPKSELFSYFPDLVEVAENCKFKDCRHEPDNSGCAFHNLDEELDEHLILYERLFSYMKMRDEVESIPDWKK